MVARGSRPAYSAGVMWSPPWKRLVAELKDRDAESRPAHLDRIAARVDTGMTPRSLERELLEEMAQALARAHDKMAVALLDLTEAERAVTAAAGESEYRARVTAYQQRRERALTARWELMIHREALGFHRHDDLERSYPIPPPLPGHTQPSRERS